MAVKPEAVLIQKPLDTGLSKREIKEIMEILKPDFRTEMDLLSITGESAAALGFIDSTYPKTRPSTRAFRKF